MSKTRKEKDFLGERKIPADAYWGVQTSRAVENFPISGLKAHPDFIRAMAFIKKAAAAENADAGRLDRKLARAIVKAAEEVIAGKRIDQFVVDVYQAGAGTSFHMNMNEVLANRAAELLGGGRGTYDIVHPNDHVNMGQSTNDVFPTAMRLAALMLLDKLRPVLDDLTDALAAKSKEFRKIVKSGRTHLQDATPVTLGQEFGGYAEAIRRCKRHLEASADHLRDLGIGGSAVGTGALTHPGYRQGVLKRLSRLMGMKLRPSANTFEAMQSNAPFAMVSSALKALALELIRIANDLRLLSSGPNTGLGEIELPATQPGSSIMPGKVNPVMAEVLDMVCFQVVGNDLTIAMAVQAGQMELNVMMPVINFNLLQSVEILTNCLRTFTCRCIKGIVASRAVCRDYALKSVGLATLLRPIIGYHASAEVAREAVRTGRSIGDLAVEKGLLTKEQMDDLLRPERLSPDR
ncbi:MAG: aspartate ammonia-lyase [Planctomycetota bacterium]